jgi:hypothetical protein
LYPVLYDIYKTNAIKETNETKIALGALALTHPDKIKVLSRKGKDSLSIAFAIRMIVQIFAIALHFLGIYTIALGLS